MRLDDRCLACVFQQLERTGRLLGLDRARRRRIMRLGLGAAARLDFARLTAPQFAEKVFDSLTAVCGRPDPYRRLKDELNRLVQDNLAFFRRRIDTAADPLRISGLYALLGNIIDYGVPDLFSRRDLFQEADALKPDLDDYPRLRRQLALADRLLYIGDNTGEAVLDVLFIEQLKRVNPRLQVVYAVRAKPAINDVTEGDARKAGVGRVAEIISSGSTFAGTIPILGSACFRRHFQRADLVIAKGQGNFETMETEKRDIFFVFKIKCAVVADYLRLPAGAVIFAFNDRILNRRQG